MELVLLVLSQSRKKRGYVFFQEFVPGLSLRARTVEYGRHMWLVLCTHCKLKVDQDKVAALLVVMYYMMNITRVVNARLQVS